MSLSCIRLLLLCSFYLGGLVRVNKIIKEEDPSAPCSLSLEALRLFFWRADPDVDPKASAPTSPWEGSGISAALERTSLMDKRVLVALSLAMILTSLYHQFNGAVVRLEIQYQRFLITS